MARILLHIGVWCCIVQSVYATPQVQEIECTLTSAEYRATQHTAAAPFTAFGFKIADTTLAATPPVLKARFSSDAINWTPWRTAPIDDDMSDTAAGPFYFTLLSLESPASYFECQFEGDPPAHDGPATGTAYLIDPGRSTVDAKRKRKIIKRRAWDCPDGKNSPLWEPEYATVTHLVVHHTDTENSAADWPAVVRSIWLYHTETRGWGDIGYNYLCDPNGVIYEGRAGGNGAIGAHFSCQSSGTIGIALLGTFSSSYPTQKQVRALEKILAQCARRNAIDPLAKTVHPATGLNLSTICGHRDANTSEMACSMTVCPGHDLYESLPQIRASVKTRLEK